MARADADSLRLAKATDHPFPPEAEPRQPAGASIQGLLLALAAPVLLIVAAVAGGMTLPAAVLPASAHAAAVGDCYDAALMAEVDAVSLGRPPVDCSAAHTMQVFALAEVSGELSVWSERPSLQALWRFREQAGLCSAEQLRAYLGAGERESLYRISIRAYFPTIERWREGDRAVSCVLFVAGEDGAPSLIGVDLAGVFASERSASLRTCYLQDRSAEGWSLSAREIGCDQPHTAQDINAWLPLGTVAEPSQPVIEASCLRFALQALAAQALPDGLHAGGVVWDEGNGTYTLRCTIGGDLDDDHLIGFIRAA